LSAEVHCDVDRHGWPTWFASDNVFLSPDHLPFLQSRFEEKLLDEADGPIPYLPFVRVPYYVFLGSKRVGTTGTT
jgi:S-adenosylmethionine-diacylgycerolhomoserine-N-methlytransferase